MGVEHSRHTRSLSRKSSLGIISHSHRHVNNTTISKATSMPVTSSFESREYATISSSKSFDNNVKLTRKKSAPFQRLAKNMKKHTATLTGDEAESHGYGVSWADYGNIKPTDNRMKKQFMMAHEIYNELFQGRFKAPVNGTLDAGGRVLDVGCGNAYWSFTMAGQYPRSHFYGVDCTDEFLNANNLPTPMNFSFVLNDIHEGLPFPNGFFDFVFCSMMQLYIRIDQWPIVMSELERVTKPGGYIQLLEGDIRTYQPTLCPIYEEIYQKIASSMRNRENKDLLIGTKLTDLLESQSGLVFVTGHCVKAPVGWNGTFGLACSSVLEFLISSFFRILAIPYDDDHNSKVASALEELAENQINLNIYCAYAQKSMFR